MKRKIPKGSGPNTQKEQQSRGGVTINNKFHSVEAVRSLSKPKMKKK